MKANSEVKMIKNFKFDYDFENDDLFLFDPNSKSKASIEMGDFIIDYNSKKEISALEILNASKFFKDIDSKFALTKEILRQIKKCKVEVSSKSNFTMIKVIFRFNFEKEVIAPLFIPSISKSSPAISI